MAEVSRRAGVGMATLYRNFPGRRELLEALYTDEVDAVCDAAETLEAGRRAGSSPGCTASPRSRPSKRHVATELLEGRRRQRPRASARTARACSPPAAPLLAAAQRAGEIRADLTLEQVLDMVIADRHDPRRAGYVEPILQAALDGLPP